MISKSCRLEMKIPLVWQWAVNECDNMISMLAKDG